jgi:hypothetical protein
LRGSLALAAVSRVARAAPSRNIEEIYRSRWLADLNDSQLIAAASQLVSAPEDESSSFTLHAPLELIARSALLPLVLPADRELARMQIVASAAIYQEEAHTAPLPPARPAFAQPALAEREIVAAYRARDREAMDGLVLQMGQQYGAVAVARVLAPLALPALTAASHTHIGLWLLLRHGGDVTLLRGAVRKLASDPGARLKSFGGMKLEGRGKGPGPTAVEREVLTKLADPPRVPAPERGGIRAIMETGERTGTIDRLFGALMAADLSDAEIDAGFRAIARVSATLALQTRSTDAHPLTIPQAAWGLSSSHFHRKLALACALVWITSYRIVGSGKLDFSQQPRPPAGNVSFQEAIERGPEVAAARFWHARPEESLEVERVLASEASVRGSQHLAKYTRACLDMTALDPPSRRLHVAAAAVRNSLAAARMPRRTILEQSTVERG